MTPRLAALATSLALLAGFTGTAQAAPPLVADFNVRAGTEKTKGQALATGTLRVGPHRMWGTFRINDLCPKDGYAAHVRITAFFNNSKNKQPEDRTFRDSSGCSAAGREYTIDSTYKRTITSIRVFVYELVPGTSRGGDQAWRYFDRKTTGR